MKTIELLKPIEGMKGVITKVVLKPPTGHAFLTLGEPWVIVRSGDGGTSQMELTQTIAAYVEVCIEEPKDATAVLGMLSLADAMRVKEAVLDFFGDARLAGLPKSPGSSSSTSDGSQPQTSDE